MKVLPHKDFTMKELARRRILFLFGLVFAAFPMSALSQDCHSILVKADNLYVSQERATAEELYRQCKKPFDDNESVAFFPDAIADASQLSPGGQKLWQLAQEGLEQNLDSKVTVALGQLNERHPEFIPAYILRAERSKDSNQEEYLSTLEKASLRFPHNVDIARTRVSALREAGERLDASITARLFSIINEQHPDAEEFKKIADDDLKAFRNGIKRQYLGISVIGGIGNVLLGRRDRALANALNSAGLAKMMFDGEAKMGLRLAASQIEKNELIEDPVVVEYVNRIGEDMAQLMGRDEFDYEFYVIDDDSLNAFALPGGKVFINKGAIMAANSEAELAGVIAHETAHAVLSHGYQQISRKNLLASMSKAIPIGNIAGYAVLGMSRDQERDADILATRALAGYGYAADGLHNWFATLNQQSGSRQPEYLSTHPATDTRLQYLRALIQQNGYNRYSYEGVKEHSLIKKRLQEMQ